MMKFKYLDDVLLLVGCACVVAGVWQISIPAAFITSGVILIGLAVMIGKIKGKHDNQ
ncbi:MAG: hypothetical protein GYA45_11820 [Pelolinea sp.]|nr:hypothetical protein [Pelolinea sp.]